MLRAQGFDPAELRKQRERALEEASNRPLLTAHTVVQNPSQLYPNVYDSLAKAKLTAAYIAGSKVSGTILLSRHFTNQDTSFCPKGVLIREAPLYTVDPLKCGHVTLM